MRNNGFLKSCPSGNIMIDTVRQNTPTPHGNTSHSMEEVTSIMRRIRADENLVFPGSRYSKHEINESTKECDL